MLFSWIRLFWHALKYHNKMPITRGEMRPEPDRILDLPEGRFLAKPIWSAIGAARKLFTIENPEFRMVLNKSGYYRLIFNWIECTGGIGQDSSRTNQVGSLLQDR